MLMYIAIEVDSTIAQHGPDDLKRNVNFFSWSGQGFIFSRTRLFASVITQIIQYSVVADLH